MNLEPYLPVILFILVGIGVGVVPQVLGFLAGPQRPDAAKNSPYECGFEAFEDARMKFDVRYYLVAILFILFDLEIAFLFPWAVALREIGPTWLLGHDGFPGHPRRGFCLRMEKGCARLGMMVPLVQRARRTIPRGDAARLGAARRSALLHFEGLYGH